MQKHYTVKEKNPPQTNQLKKDTINSILNFSKSFEVLKGKKQNVELILN
jgi:hypothetical protein